MWNGCRRSHNISSALICRLPFPVSVSLRWKGGTADVCTLPSLSYCMPISQSWKARFLPFIILPLLVSFFALNLKSPRSLLHRLNPYLLPSRQYSINMSLSSKLSITDVDLKGQRVLIRVDFNVP